MPKLSYALTAVFALALGFIAANTLIARLQITVNTEREFLVTQVSQSFKPPTKSTLALQNTIYQQRVDSLNNRIKKSELQAKSIIQYLQPLEKELITYRDAFSEKARANQDERLQLYIDIVNKYRDYNRAVKSLESFIPLNESDSLLSLHSVQLDLVYDAGGALAQTHNQFIDEPRNSSFASHYELQLRQFLRTFKLNSVLVECHSYLCAVHLGHVWQEPYYRGFDTVWQQLIQEPWMDLQLAGDAHQYRGKGHQVQVWYLEAAQ
jgi:hypothetical protein